MCAVQSVTIVFVYTQKKASVHSCTDRSAVFSFAGREAPGKIGTHLYEMLVQRANLGREAPRKKVLSDFSGTSKHPNLSKNKQKNWIFVAFGVFYTICFYTKPPPPWVVDEPECEVEREC